MLEKLPGIVGLALRERRAGLDKVLFNRFDLRGGTGVIEVTSLAFADHAPIPVIYTADGEGDSPPLEWRGVPAGADSLLLVVEDADSPTPLPLVHAIVTGLAPCDGGLAAGAIDRGRINDAQEGGGPDAAVGRNSFLDTGWLPPDPPPGHGTHRYVFQVFALAGGARSETPAGSTPGRDVASRLIEAHAVASGLLVGTYERPDGTVKADDAERVGSKATVTSVGPGDLAGG
ncbi:MAG: YbhB/YbcL family Raf kinase inhibitor-like protein [Burkholderiaceae bacterium]|nr:YbhB/YbcL family Raf kinase inhibitor-like protein [Burkholderiaceae bacterium]